MKTMIEPSAPTATRLRSEPDLRMATPRQAKTRVLIVDDNQRFAEGARAILQRTGHHTVCVETNALRALETARSFKPDLLLVDLVMPEIDGVELGTQIGGDWALHDVPIVFVTCTDHSGRGARRASHRWTSHLGEAAHCRRASARSRGKPAVLCRGLTNQLFSSSNNKHNHSGLDHFTRKRYSLFRLNHRSVGIRERTTTE